MTTTVSKRTRPRKVFGRVRAAINGNGTVIFEMRKDGVRFRPLRSRKEPVFLSFHELLGFGSGQLYFNMHGARSRAA